MSNVSPDSSKLAIPTSFIPTLNRGFPTVGMSEISVKVAETQFSIEMRNLYVNDVVENQSRWDPEYYGERGVCRFNRI